MAFSLFNSGAAQAYANSFSPWKANGGYDKVKSEIGKDIFTQIPFLNFKAEVEMAKAGLAGYTGATKQKMVTDSNERINEAKIEYYDRDREDRQKESKKAALAQMLSGGGGGGAARSIANRGSSAELMGVMRGGDPLTDAVAITRNEQGLRGMAHNDIAPVAAATRTALRGATNVPASSNTQLQLPTVTTPQVQQAPAPSVSSGGSEFSIDATMQSILKSMRSGDQK